MIEYNPMGRIWYWQENEGTSQWRGLSVDKVVVDVESFTHGPSHTTIALVNNEGQRIPVMLSQKDTKRLAIQLLMGVLS